MKLELVTTILAVSLLAAPVVDGADAPGSFSLSPLSGIHVFSGKDRLDSAPVFGIKSTYEIVGHDLSDSIAVEGGFGYVDTKTKENENAEVYVINVDAVYPLLPTRQASPYFAIGAGGMYVDRPDDSFFNPFLNYGLGLRYFFQEWVAGRIDARHIIEFDEGRRNNYEFLFGLSFLLTREEKLSRVPVVDRDRDGVPDRRDRCPGTPAGVKVDSSGCPPDADGDGVADNLDKCADTPKGVSIDKNGCPLDIDSDGVPDYLDRCPDSKPAEKVTPEGCPEPEKVGSADPERMVEVLAGVIRRDPLMGIGEAFSVSRGDRSSFARLYIYEHQRNEKTVPSSAKAELGKVIPEDTLLKKEVQEDILYCPDDPVLQSRAEGVLGEYGVLFAFNSSKIGRKQDVPRKIALFLKYNPEVTAVIEGHADSTGDSRYNLTLSRVRAGMLKKVLVKEYGVAPERVKISAYGCSRPVAGNRNEDGRRENRRAVTVFSVSKVD